MVKSKKSKMKGTNEVDTDLQQRLDGLDSEAIDQILEALEPAPVPQVLARKCTYPTCENLIPLTHQFSMCDTCRILAAGNAVRLILAPCAPIAMQRAAEVEHRMLTSMTGPEVLSYFTRLESHYLAVLKIKALHTDATRNTRTIVETINHERGLVQAECDRANEKRRKRNEPGRAKGGTRKPKKTKLETLTGLGLSEAKARESMEETYDF
ncbi:MAG: hypothetical protein WCC64_21310 [Aliidongia sp.]